MRLRHFLTNLTPPLVAQLCGKVWHRYRRGCVRRLLRGETRLHLGCGSNALAGWANLDLKGRGTVIGWNLTAGLPVESGTIALIFSEHFIEHITRDQAARLLADCHRVLQPDGILRISTPNLRTLVEEYRSGKISDWRDVGWVPATPCRLVNEGLHLWGHQFVYDFDELKSLLESAGFRSVQPVARHESTTPELRGLERRPSHGDLIIEAGK